MRLLPYIFVLLLVGCQRDTLLHAYRAVPVSDYYLKDTARFAVPATSEGGEWDISLGLRYKHNYPFESIFMVVEQRYTDPWFNVRDTVEVPLPRGGGGALAETEVPVTSTLLAPHQSGEVLVYHITHPAHLRGISDVGLHLTRTSRVEREEDEE